MDSVGIVAFFIVGLLITGVAFVCGIVVGYYLATLDSRHRELMTPTKRNFTPPYEGRGVEDFGRVRRDTIGDAIAESRALEDSVELTEEDWDEIHERMVH